VGVLRNLVSEGILGGLIRDRPKYKNQWQQSSWWGGPAPMRSGYDAAGFRRRLSTWLPSQYTTNVILTSSGRLLRSRCRDVMRNNPHAVAAGESFAANVIGTGIKPSSLYNENPRLRSVLQALWNDWVDECDADGIADFYGLQTIVARALFECGECFVRFRNRKVDDGFLVPLQLQLLESDMCPYEWNMQAPNGNWIMNGVELDSIGRRTAYWFFPTHPGDMPIEPVATLQPVRVPASEVLHIYKCTRPGQVRGVPLLTPALVRMFFLDQYDDAELERKRIAAMFAGFVTAAVPEDVLADVNTQTAMSNYYAGLYGVADADTDVGVAPLEPGTMQTLRPGEDVKFSEPADVGGSYEAFQYRNLLSVYAAVGIPYSIGTSDLRRANYSSLRGSIVEFRRRVEQLQRNVFVFQMCRPIWKRWLDTAILASALDVDAATYLMRKVVFQRVKWIPQRNDWVDPLKDRQAEKLAVDAGFKSRSDVIEAEGFDPEENDQRIKADADRAEQLDLTFPVVYAAASQPMAPSDQAAAEQAKADAQDAADQAAQEAADDAAVAA
jgi:lambda family phage portal protein